MASPHVEAFQRGADAINRLDADALAELVHEDAVFEPIRAATEGAYIGPEGIRRFIADTEETFDVFEATLDEVSDAGNGRVLAIGKIRMRGRGSGFENDVTTAAVAEFRDGLLTRYKDYGDPTLARQAAGGDW
jgi:ketosteroid isomerase-like protein